LTRIQTQVSNDASVNNNEVGKMNTNQAREIILVLWLIATFISSSISGFSPITALCGLLTIAACLRVIVGAFIK
jgi:hypothetical protein